ncbi:ABC transporter ATP-binding protein [Aquamicrobium sp. LC103]|nr:ABC transporter ATP-binding protein [Aquamicrobium sp. LC103]
MKADAPRVASGANITIDGLAKRFGQVTAVDHFSVDIAAGEFLALLGPSGSGKTTVLMSIAGFEFPTEGSIRIGGEDVTYTPANRRNLGMVFQKYTLFPHLSVLDNVAFPLKMRGVSKPERHKRAEAALATVRLAGYGSRMPNQLSGGQQQRVALARAIVYHPRVLLMDEPLSALDKNLREEMQLEIKRLHSELGITVVFVTHDQAEALTMANRVAVLKDGRIQQIGPAPELYERPANLFTAGFIGEMNFLPGRLAAAGKTPSIKLDAGPEWRLPAAALIDTPSPGQSVVATVRPERVSLGSEGAAGAIPVRVQDVVYAGAAVLLIGVADCGTELRARLSGVSEVADLRPGDMAHLVVPPEAVLLYAGAAAA